VAHCAGPEQGTRLLVEAAQATPGLLPLAGRESDDPVDTTSGLAQLRLFDALARLFADLAGQRPTMVVIEDVHWADPSTQVFLSFLCRNLPARPFALAVTARTDELHRRHPLRPLLGELAHLPSVRAIELGPLDVAEIAELLAWRHGAPMPRDAVGGIARRSGGNPFYAEQLFRTIAWGGTMDGGERRIKNFLMRAGINPNELSLRDGSGLSRKNMVSPASLAHLVAHMYREHPERETFIESLPQGGENLSTLRNRLSADNVKAKTGSMEFVRALSGYTYSRTGVPVAFTVVANNYAERASEVSRLQDEIVRTINSLDVTDIHSLN
jgi:hypothetical protein